MIEKRLYTLAFLMTFIMLIASCGSGGQSGDSASNNNDDENDDQSIISGFANLLPGTLLKAGDDVIDAGDYSVPAVYDWNDDGKKDLLVGYNDPDSSKGFIRIYENVGTDSTPLFDGYTLMQACNNECTLSVNADKGY